MDFESLFERWQATEEVNAETLQLIRDTVRYMNEVDDDEMADRAGDLLSGAYHLAVDSEEAQKIGEALGQ